MNGRSALGLWVPESLTVYPPLFLLLTVCYSQTIAEDGYVSSDATRLRAQKPLLHSSSVAGGELIMPVTTLIQGIQQTDDEQDGSETVEKDDDVLSSESKSLTAALARTFGRLEQLDIAKELYLAILARDHPFPFCAWQVGVAHIIGSHYLRPSSVELLDVLTDIAIPTGGV